MKKIFCLLALSLTSCISSLQPANLEESQPEEIAIAQTSSIIKNFCQELDEKFTKYQWGESQCADIKWESVRSSHQGRPLMWKVFGEEKLSNNTTLILCGVHGDEITPIKFCFDIINNLQNHPMDLKDNTLVIVPLVSPDSFIKENPTRTNFKGVDVNRNFPTKDWDEFALSSWKNHYGSDTRRYPGPHAMSEPETLFQVNLIKRFQPHKIISVHAPLTLLDYDGPRLTGKTTISLGEKLLKTMSKKAFDYKIKNYPFFPGSLGNYSGNERHIPTYTLELPNSDFTRTDEFWNLFKEAIRDAILTDFREASSDKSSQE